MMNKAEIIKSILKVGKILFEKKVQNTHSGNISHIYNNNKLLITKSGSMKGYLKEEDIIELFLDDKDFKKKNASTETGTHQEILKLKKKGAIIHIHSLDSTILSFIKNKINPIDFYGKNLLNSIPVLEFSNPIGSDEMVNKIPKYFNDFNSIIVKTHGIFSWGKNLGESLYYSLISDYSSKILLNLIKYNININKINLNYDNFEFLFEFNDCEINKENKGIEKTNDLKLLSDILYKSDLSPVFTGFYSFIKDIDIYYSNGISIPDFYESKSVFKFNKKNNVFFEILNYIRLTSKFKILIFNSSVFSIIHSFINYINGDEFIIPNDAEGKLLYPKIPTIPPDVSASKLIDLLYRYKIVLIIGVGAISVGKEINKTIHHNSSLENISKINLNLMKIYQDID